MNTESTHYKYIFASMNLIYIVLIQVPSLWNIINPCVIVKDPYLSEGKQLQKKVQQNQLRMTVLPRTRGYRTAAALLPQLESVLDNKLAYLEHCVYAEKSFKYCNEDGVKKMMEKIGSNQIPDMESIRKQFSSGKELNVERLNAISVPQRVL